MSIQKTDEVVFALNRVNPTTVDLYENLYEMIKTYDDNGLLEKRLKHLMSMSESIDSASIPIMVNTIFKEVVRTSLGTKGVTVARDITLEEIYRAYTLIIDIRDSDDIVDLLRHSDVSSCDISFITTELGLPYFEVADVIEDTDTFIEILYEMYYEQINRVESEPLELPDVAI